MARLPHLKSYSSTVYSDDTVLIDNAQEFVFDTYAAIPQLLGSKIDPDSVEAQYGQSLADILKKNVPQIILAKDEAEFEALYQACIDEMKANYLAEYTALLLNLTHEYIKTNEAYGIVFN